MNFNEKITLITGSTSGIGKATAQKLLNSGAKVIVSSDKVHDLSEIQNLFNDSKNIDYIKCDISQKSDIDEALETIKDKHGRLDYLVANA